MDYLKQDQVAASEGTSESPCSMPSLYETPFHELSCDECASQEGRHYCLTFSCQVKNMDTVRCPSWHPHESNVPAHRTPGADTTKDDKP